MGYARRAVFLSGERGAGKTTLCLKLARTIEGAGGIVCPALFDDHGDKIGFECLAVGSGESWKLGRGRADAPGSVTKNATGKYLFDSQGVLRAVDLIVESVERDGGLTVIDEIGPLELRGGGFSPVLPLLSGASDLILVVRPGLIDKVMPFVPNHTTRVVYLTELNRPAVEREIAVFLSGRSDSS